MSHLGLSLAEAPSTQNSLSASLHSSIPSREPPLGRSPTEVLPPLLGPLTVSHPVSLTLPLNHPQLLQAAPPYRPHAVPLFHLPALPTNLFSPLSSYPLFFLPLFSPPRSHLPRATPAMFLMSRSSSLSPPCPNPILPEPPLTESQHPYLKHLPLVCWSLRRPTPIPHLLHHPHPRLLHPSSSNHSLTPSSATLPSPLFNRVSVKGKRKSNHLSPSPSVRLITLAAEKLVDYALSDFHRDLSDMFLKISIRRDN